MRVDLNPAPSRRGFNKDRCERYPSRTLLHEYTRFPRVLRRTAERLTHFLDGTDVAAMNEGRSNLRRQTYGCQFVGKDWGRMLKVWAAPIRTGRPIDSERLSTGLSGFE